MKKKLLIIIISILLFITLTSTTYSFIFPDAEDTVEKYIKAWQEGDFEGIHRLLSRDSQEAITVEELEEAYNYFWDMAGIEYLKVYNIKEDTWNENTFLLQSVHQSKYFDEVYLGFPITLKRERLINWRIVWDYDLIEFGFKPGDTFVRERIMPERGKIYLKQSRKLHPSYCIGWR
ncbi:NTF2-like N-terminal transpeptidase domain-containing protein, partial [Natronospora cellulosivora (SeqCode)]